MDDYYKLGFEAMKILFDSQIFNAQKYGGISRYFVNLANELNHIEGNKTAIFAPTYINNYLQTVPECDRFYGIKQNIKLKLISRGLSHIACHLAIPFIRPDIIHKTYYYPERYSMRSGRSLLTVYDMIHELYPENFGRLDKTSKYKYEAVMRADHIICISENTRSDLLKIWDCDPKKVSVVHLGFDDFGNTPVLTKETVWKNDLDNYILFVGSRSGHKNFSRLLKAFGLIDDLNKNFRLICFGGGSLNDDEIGLINRLGLRDRVIQVEGDDATLGQLYRDAALFVYPSIYEGFGIPPLEAMSAGCPVACSRSSSIPEVCGAAVDYFNPLDPDSIASSLARVLGSTNYREMIALSGIEQAKKFSWRKCAIETLQTYHTASVS